MRALARAATGSLVALCVVLVVGSGLLVRTLQHLTQLRPGFDATNVMTATLSLQDARYATSERVNQLFDRTLEQIKQVPGVERAAVALAVALEVDSAPEMARMGRTSQHRLGNVRHLEFLQANLLIPPRTFRTQNRAISAARHLSSPKRPWRTTSASVRIA